eukprot:gb/GFBE01076760.1/.p1 GENE.gb/GFBE01076760.1/~~gb/GFBE01076760.1/.p1  ORF type:complete len:344 (+),score=115.60 gb/GFBE01076760.1/:1-1032(+)
MDGKGKGKWGARRDDAALDEKPQAHHHNLEGAYSAKDTSQRPLKSVEMDCLVYMQIMKHCRQHVPQAVTGQLLGMDVEDVLQLTHSFGYVQRNDKSWEETQGQSQDDGSDYTLDTLKRLRDVNVDSNVVGWYQTTHLGQFISTTVIDSQFKYQTEIPRSVLVVYDSLQAAIGKPSFKALQLRSDFMQMYNSVSAAAKADLVDIPVNEMFVEIPITVTSNPLAECFLLDWAIADPLTTMSQVETLDVENQAFFEKNVQLLTTALQELADEQQKVVMFERNMGRGGKGDDKGKGKGYRWNQGAPKPIDTMVLSKQIQNYCKAINSYAGDAFSKVYLVSNKPKASK